jgi:CubicO group peptidase (beta-lactamase class C family)
LKLLFLLIKTYFLLLILCLPNMYVHASTEDSKEDSSNHDELLKTESKRIVHQYVDMGWFSGTVLVAKNGQVIYEDVFGYSDVIKGTKNTLKTRYNLGSILKNYTAVLALQLVESKRLDLNDNLAKFDLGFPSNIANKITVYHLLAHQSGFGDVFTAEYRSDSLAYDTIQKKLSLRMNKPLEFEPGTETRYSNYGYIVLGAIMEQVTNKTYAQLLEGNILKRLGLANFHYTQYENAENLSQKYSYNYEGKQIYVGDTERPSPDGGLETGVYDTLNFYRALFHGDTLLSSSSIATLREVSGMSADSWHSFGGGTGVSAAVEVDFTSGLEIIVLANTDKIVAERISGRIFQFARSGTYPPIRLEPRVFTYKFYSKVGSDHFNQHFSEEYKNAGYTTFKGRIVNEVGMALLADKRYSTAIDMFNALVKLYPNAPGVYDSLAWGYMQQGERKKALEAFAKAKALDASYESSYSSNNYLELTSQ